MKKNNLFSLVLGILIGIGSIAPAAQAAEQFLKATPSTQTFYVNGQQVELEAYAINGYNYVRLKDIGEAVGFQLTYDPVQNAAIISTTLAQPDKPSSAVEKMPDANTDYSAQANPAIFTGELTREAYNGVRDTLLHQREIIAGDYQPIPVGKVKLGGHLDQAVIAIGQYPVFELASGGNGQKVCRAKYPNASKQAAEHTQVFIDGISALSETEKVKQMVWYVCDRITYQAKYPGPGTVLSQDGQIPGCCMSYSYSFQFLCDRAGIPCVLVCNDIHMWNRVYVDGRWWDVDVTGADADDDVQGRKYAAILHEPGTLQGRIFEDRYPQVTRFAQELLVPGSTK